MDDILGKGDVGFYVGQRLLGQSETKRYCFWKGTGGGRYRSEDQRRLARVRVGAICNEG